MVPLFPFFIVNLLMGLTPIKTFYFYIVSQIGMLLGTAVYINAGSELAQITSLSGLLSVSLVFSFSLLGLFPLIARGIVNYMQHFDESVIWTHHSINNNFCQLTQNGNEP